MYKKHYCKFRLGCYTGERTQSRNEGLGVYHFPSGGRYEGEFMDSAFHGKGKRIRLKC